MFIRTDLIICVTLIFVLLFRVWRLMYFKIVVYLRFAAVKTSRWECSERACGTYVK